MKKIHFLLIFLCLGFQAAAQKDFRKGYVIKLNGDTIRGEVRFQSFRKNAQRCEFKIASPAQKFFYTPDDILAYGFDAGPTYQSHLLSEKAYAAANKPTAKKNYFLNVLVQAPASLLVTYEATGKTRFFVQKDTVFQELEILKKLVKNEKDGKYYKTESKLYIGTLTYLLKDCPAIQPTLNKTEFKASALTALIKKYNECANPGVPMVVQKPAKPVVKLGIIGGTNISFIKISPPWRTTEINQENVLKPGITAGFTFNSSLPLLGNKMSLQAELAFVRSFFNTSYQYQRSEDFSGTPVAPVNFKLTSDLRLDFIELPIMIRYTFNYKKVKPYLNAGLLYSYFLDQENNSYIEGYYPTQTTKIRMADITSLSKFTVSLVGAGGVLIPLGPAKNLVLETKFRPEFIPHLYNFDSSINTFHVVTGIQF